MRKVFFLFISLFAIGLIIVFGYKSLVSLIYHSNSCEQFNIDNIEVRTGINIPSVDKVTCNFIASKNTKIASFFINKKAVNIESYILRNKFVWDENQYINRGERVDTKWTAILNKETGELVVSLTYI